MKLQQLVREIHWLELPSRHLSVRLSTLVLTPPGLNFAQPNLPYLIEEIERELL